MPSSSNSKSSRTATAPEFTKQPHVLLVDDEDLLREVIAIMIEEGGGTVIHARDGVEALRLFREHRKVVNCVLLDFSMPGRNGYETYKDIILEDPAARVVMVSGLRVLPEVQTLVLTKKIGFLSKPFHEADLVRAINEALT